jgi:hypothetical protein
MVKLNISTSTVFQSDETIRHLPIKSVKISRHAWSLFSCDYVKILEWRCDILGSSWIMDSLISNFNWRDLVLSLGKFPVFTK